MKCPRCGADSSVKETRAWEFGTAVRRRECFNNHRFTTVEIYRGVYGSARQRAKTYAQSMTQWRALWVRNMDMFRHSHLGWQHFMNKYRVGRSNFFYVVRQMREQLLRKK